MALSEEQILMLLVGGFMLLAVLFLADLNKASSPVVKRAHSVRQRHTQSKQSASLKSDGIGNNQGKSLQITGLLQRLNLTDRKVQEPIKLKLMAAGLRGKNAVELFLFSKLICPFVIGFVGYLMLVGGFFGEMETGQIMMFGAVGVLVGYMAPETYVSNLKSKRSKNIQKSLPDGLDLLVICAEAGLSLDMALNRVSAELEPTGPELADELALTSVELNFLPERRTALQNLAARIDSKAIRSVVNTLLQTEKYGTPLTQSLRVLSEEFREERMLKAEEKAARLPAILTVPMIVFILPTLFIVLIGPAGIDVYDQFMK